MGIGFLFAMLVATLNALMLAGIVKLSRRVARGRRLARRIVSSDPKPVAVTIVLGGDAMRPAYVAGSEGHMSLWTGLSGSTLDAMNPTAIASLAGLAIPDVWDAIALRYRRPNFCEAILASPFAH